MPTWRDVIIKLSNQISEQPETLQPLIESFGIECYSDTPFTVRSKCPHGSSRSDTARIAINPNGEPNKVLWQCYSQQCQRKKGNDLISFLIYATGLSAKDALRRSQNFLSKTTPVNAPQSTKTPRYKKQQSTDLTILGSIVTPSREFLVRGFAARTLNHFGVGDKDGCSYIPIKGIDGKAIGYTTRYYDPAQSKYRHNYGLPKTDIVYNYEGLNYKTVIIVEGPTDVWKLWENGYPNSIALLGCDFSRRQASLIHSVSGLSTIIVASDNDEAGHNPLSRHQGANAINASSIKTHSQQQRYLRFH